MGHFDERALDEAAARLTEQGVDVLRIAYPDLLGTERGRDILVNRLSRTLADGVAFCRSVYGVTPMGDLVDIEGGLSDGLPDVVVFPDLATLRVVPWESGVASCISDVFNPDGSASLESPRHVLKNMIARFDELGMRPLIGPELEFYVFEPSEASANGWRRYGEAPGNVYATGLRGDPDNLLLRLLRNLSAYEVDVFAANHEYSSGQFEINLWHSEALDAADRAFRFKAAIKEVARQDGKLATFMAKPANDEGASGFHIHFSTVGQDGAPLFDDPQGEFGLSDLARSAIAGVLRHAPALAAICNPTINSYKRFGPDTLAPWLIDWGLDNRSAMIRVPPERGRASRMEVRLGDSSANPYLAFAAVLAAVYLGIRDSIQPPAPLVGYGYDTSKALQLPGDLRAALAALEADTELTEMLGGRFVDAFLKYKRNELERFDHWVTDWEFREYTYHL